MKDRPNSCRWTVFRTFTSLTISILAQQEVSFALSTLLPPQEELQRPIVTLKIAVDSNGGVVDLDPRTPVERFTSPASLDMVHRLRARSDAVLVGRTTVEKDNPSLLVRRGVTVSQQPRRVVLDTHLQCLNNDDYQVFTDGFPTVVYHHSHQPINTNRHINQTPKDANNKSDEMFFITTTANKKNG